MSDLTNNSVPTGEPAEEITAQGFIEKELIESRASLVRTRIVGGVLAVFTLVYMGYLTSGFRSSLEPVGAAEIATGLATQRLDDLEPRFAEYIHEQVPMMIRKAPDEIISRMPEYRKGLEDRVESDLRAQASSGSDELSKNLESFLTAHKDSVGALIKDGQDSAATELMGVQLEAQFRTFLHDVKVGGTSIDEKLSETLSTLRQVQARTARLAGNKGLTPSEKSARHAVAMLMHRIGQAKDDGVVASAQNAVVNVGTAIQP